MKNRFRFTILLLTCCLLLAQGGMIALAETEGSAEGGVNVTQSGEMSMDDTLSSLKIAQATLNPEFSPNQLTYTATVPYEVERVALTAQTSSPEARKVIRGTSDLKVGENTITVTVTAENGSVREYRITLIRQEMPETTPPVSDETPEVSGSDEGDSQSDTSEAAPDETSAEETQEMTPEETTPQETTPEETIIAPPTTEPNGGMLVETDEEEPRDINSLLLNPVFLICLVGAIMLISLIVIVVAVIVLREKFLGGKDDDDDDEEDEGEEIDEDFEEILEESFEEILEESSQEPFEEISEKTSQETMESPSVYYVKKSEENVVDTASDDDLDDDFEMLLEDDDDFDFLDF